VHTGNRSANTQRRVTGKEQNNWAAPEPARSVLNRLRQRRRGATSPWRVEHPPCRRRISDRGRCGK